jgi:hypothetical protein
MLQVQSSDAPETLKSFRSSRFVAWWDAYNSALSTHGLPEAQYGEARDAMELGQSPEIAAAYQARHGAKTIEIPQQTAPARVKRICSHCKGENVKVDAWAAWDVDAQTWTAEEVFEAGHCDDCDGETRVIAAPLSAGSASAASASSARSTG